MEWCLGWRGVTTPHRLLSVSPVSLQIVQSGSIFFQTASSAMASEAPPRRSADFQAKEQSRDTRGRSQADPFVDRTAKYGVLYRVVSQ